MRDTARGFVVFASSLHQAFLLSCSTCQFTTERTTCKTYEMHVMWAPSESIFKISFGCGRSVSEVLMLLNFWAEYFYPHKCNNSSPEKVGTLQYSHLFIF